MSVNNIDITEPWAFKITIWIHMHYANAANERHI